MYVNDINSLISNKFRMKGKLEDGKTALDPKAVGKTIWLEKLPGLEVKLCFSLILEKLISSLFLKIEKNANELPIQAKNSVSIENNNYDILFLNSVFFTVAYDNPGISPVIRQTLQHWGYRWIQDILIFFFHYFSKNDDFLQTDWKRLQRRKETSQDVNFLHKVTNNLQITTKKYSMKKTKSHFISLK